MKKIISFITIFSMAVAMIMPMSVYAKPSTHTVTFMYGTKTQKIVVNDGEDVIPPTDTFFPGFVFIGWTDNLKKVKQDRLVYGAYSKTSGMVANPLQTTAYVSSLITQNYASGKRYNSNLSAGWPTIWDSKYPNLIEGEEGKTCAVHWYNGLDGTLWKTDLVQYGTSLAVPINDPYIDGYTFAGWEGSWQNITEDRCIAAHFNPMHRVTFIDTVTGSPFSTVYVEHGGTVDKPLAPEHYGMQFSYYSGVSENVQSDVTIYAFYSNVYN